jgi:hypothetical protein
MTGRSKFDELRLKTDRQLIQLANNEVGLGLRDAYKALESAENWASAERHYLAAEEACAEAARLVRLAGDIREDELSSVKSRLDHLWEVLEGLSVLGSTATPDGDKTPVLARALWKARGCPVGLPEEDWFRAERALKLQAACVGG